MNVFKFSEHLTPDQKTDLINAYSRIYDLEVFEGEGGDITTEAWDRTYSITKEFLRRLIVMGSADDEIEIINERGDVETVSRGQARTPEVDHNSEKESDNNPMYFIPDDAVLVGNEIRLLRDLGGLIERGLIERKPKTRGEEGPRISNQTLV